ncbi:hypothetical protein [Zhenhengia yiwuensis]|uniref:Uncharacterized protein n=1 Tax=Zhenhengia yiwuensis TaxID=2763666 RepID=A0A926EN78_9FIRM|nr:hypothetical protein [Zhenhengia yiwuensis]MBC8581535.1 hypothetical protein [Zhenhengia yiwuensis]
MQKVKTLSNVDTIGLATYLIDFIKEGNLVEQVINTGDGYVIIYHTVPVVSF